MNLPYPFEKASDIKANPDGTLDLIDAQGKALARISLPTAFALLREPKRDGFTRPKRDSRQDFYFGAFYFGAETSSGEGFGLGLSLGEARPYGLCFGNGSGGFVPISRQSK